MSEKDRLKLAKWDTEALTVKVAELVHSLTNRDEQIDRHTIRDIEELFLWMMQPLPEHRPNSFSEILKHPLFSQQQNEDAYVMPAVHVYAALDNGQNVTDILKRKPNLVLAREPLLKRTPFAIACENGSVIVTEAVSYTHLTLPTILLV